MTDIQTAETAGNDAFRSIDAATGLATGEAFAVHGADDVATACAAADAAFDAYRATDNAAQPARTFSNGSAKRSSRSATR